MQVRLDEAFEACSALNLTPVKLGGYLIVFNSDFDVVLCEEPYVALMLLLNIDSGKFIARIWNETVTVGKIANAEQFIEVVRNFFSGIVADTLASFLNKTNPAGKEKQRDTPIMRKLQKQGKIQPLVPTYKYQTDRPNRRRTRGPLAARTHP